MLPPCKDFEKIPARQFLALRACAMATVFFRYLYIGGYGGGTDIKKLESEPCLTLFQKQSEPITSAMIIHGTAYFKFRKSFIGPSTRLKTNDHEVLNILMKENIYTKHYNKRMAKRLATVQKDN